MITKLEALEIMEQYLNKTWHSAYVLVENATVEFDSGWVFVFTSSEYLKTRDRSLLPLGLNPVIVDNDDGSIHKMIAGPIDDHINIYQRYRDTIRSGEKNLSELMYEFFNSNTI